MQLIDRDAIITKEGLIFRVYGYNHPLKSYICDPEYASAKIFKSSNPRAKRGIKKTRYYKFFADEGLKLVFNNFPQFTIFHEPLQKCIVGVNEEDILEVRKPQLILKKLITKHKKDVLLSALENLLELILHRSKLNYENFGVFGSLLMGFHNPNFSDLDLIIYGKENFDKLVNILETLYKNENSLNNEFDTNESVFSKDWKFLNYSLDEYVWHQKRKMIYAYFSYKDAKRVIKAEFEPVKKLNKHINQFNNFMRISHKGWIKAIVEIVDDKDGPYIPSIYKIKVKEILKGPKISNIKQIFSYMEEFRLQTKKGELAIVEGNLEKVVDGINIYHQITLSYGPRYYEQVLKVI